MENDSDAATRLLEAYNRMLESRLILEDTSPQDCIEDSQDSDDKAELQNVGLEFSLFSDSKPLIVTTAVQETRVQRISKLEDYEIIESEERDMLLLESTITPALVLAQATTAWPSNFWKSRVITVNADGHIIAGVPASEREPVSRSTRKRQKIKAIRRESAKLRGQNNPYAFDLTTANNRKLIKNPNSWGRIPRSERARVLSQLKINQKSISKNQPKFKPKPKPKSKSKPKPKPNPQAKDPPQTEPIPYIGEID